MSNVQIRFVYDKNDSFGQTTDDGNIRYFCQQESIEKELCKEKKFVNSAKRLFKLKKKSEVEERIGQLHDGRKADYHSQLRKILQSNDKHLNLAFLKDLPA